MPVEEVVDLAIVVEVQGGGGVLEGFKDPARQGLDQNNASGQTLGDLPWRLWKEEAIDVSVGDPLNEGRMTHQFWGESQREIGPSLRGRAQTEMVRACT